MRRNIVILALIALVALGFWFFQEKSNQMNDDSVGMIKKTESITEKTIVVTREAEIPVADELNQPKFEMKAADEPDEYVKQALAALEEARYSNDPMVELQSVFSEYSYCHQTIMDFRLKDQHLTDKKKAQLEKLDQRCDALKVKYSFLAETGKSGVIAKALKDMPSSSPLGDMYREENTAAIRADFSAYFNRLTQQGIKAQNAQTLVRSTRLLDQPFFKVDPTLAEVLGGLDENYIRRTQHNALSLMSCEFQGGISCLPDAQIMVDKCLENELFCDMNFSNWYQLYTTDAQKNDVAVLLAHYRSL